MQLEKINKQLISSVWVRDQNIPFYFKIALSMFFIASYFFLCNLRMFIEVWPNSKPRFAVPPQASQAQVTRAHKSVGVALQATVRDMEGVTGVTQ